MKESRETEQESRKGYTRGIGLTGWNERGGQEKQRGGQRREEINGEPEV